MNADDQQGETRRVITELVEAAFRGDVEAATALCAPDVVLRMEGTQVVRGHDGLRQVIEFNEEVASDVRIEIHHVLASGETAAMNRTTFLTIGERTVELGVGSFFTLRDGKVVEWRDYQDMTEVTRALGH